MLNSHIHRSVTPPTGTQTQCSHTGDSLIHWLAREPPFGTTQHMDMSHNPADTDSQGFQPANKVTSHWENKRPVNERGARGWVRTRYKKNTMRMRQWRSLAKGRKRERNSDTNEWEWENKMKRKIKRDCKRYQIPKKWKPRFSLGHHKMNSAKCMDPFVRWRMP